MFMSEDLMMWFYFMPIKRNKICSQNGGIKFTDRKYMCNLVAYFFHVFIYWNHMRYAVLNESLSALA